MFDLSLSLDTVPVLRKTSCVVPVPKIDHPSEPSHQGPVALTPCLMMTIKRIVLACLHCSAPIVLAWSGWCCLLLHQTLSQMESFESTVRVMFFFVCLFFTSPVLFNTIQPLLRWDDDGEWYCPLPGSWVMGYLSGRPQWRRSPRSVPVHLLACHTIGSRCIQCFEAKQLSIFLFPPGGWSGWTAVRLAEAWWRFDRVNWNQEGWGSQGCYQPVLV